MFHVLLLLSQLLLFNTIFKTCKYFLRKNTLFQVYHFPLVFSRDRDKQLQTKKKGGEREKGKGREEKDTEDKTERRKEEKICHFKKNEGNKKSEERIIIK